MEKLNSQERILRIVELLADRSVDGMSNKAIAFEVKTLEANVCRDLKILEAQGWIEKSSVSGKWRLTLKFAGIAGQIMKSFQTAKLRITETEAQYASALQ